MSDNAELASRLFPGAAAEAAEGKQQQPAQTRDPAARLFPDAAAEDKQQAKPQDSRAPAAQSKPAEAKDQAKPAEATPQAVEAIASALAGQAELGLAADHPDTASFSSLAAEIGLSGENAVKLAQWDASRSEAAWDAQFKTWSDATYGEFLSSEIEDARSVVMQFGDDELHELLNGPMGLGSHPAVVRFCRNVARARRGGR